MCGTVAAGEGGVAVLMWVHVRMCSFKSALIKILMSKYTILITTPDIVCTIRMHVLHLKHEGLGLLQFWAPPYSQSYFMPLQK